MWKRTQLFSSIPLQCGGKKAFATQDIYLILIFLEGTSFILSIWTSIVERPGLLHINIFQQSSYGNSSEIVFFPTVKEFALILWGPRTMNGYKKKVCYFEPALRFEYESEGSRNFNRAYVNLLVFIYLSNWELLDKYIYIHNINTL